ncbi:putative cytochrome P450 [Tothia fuscella]|uniref:Cytochrome P450 n=1 Tax=Tothia fuscella TaxID=1048955 RepID=A0A9P4NF79_9PEZI|nr:putative cytochrome P450 [Tothia fuscella]
MAVAVDLPHIQRINIDDNEAVNSDNPEKIYEEYDFLRSQCPVAYTNRYNGFWLLTRYEDIKAAAGDSATFISSVKAVVPSDPRGLRRPPLNFDAPAHTPYATLDRTLKASRLKRLEKVLERHAEEELLPLLSRGEGNICTEFGALFSAWVETEWLNLDPDTAPLLAETAAAWVNAWRKQDGENVTKNSNVLYDIARQLLADRRKHPRDPEEDPASSLLLERDSEGEPLEEIHLVGGLRQSLVVAMIAPSILMGGICTHLSRDKELQTHLRGHPEDVPAAVEEFVRLYTPYRGFARTASKDVKINGCPIQPKQPITLSYASANRDPDAFTDPEKFVLRRENITSHLGFGRGRHRCIGMPLARLAMQTAVRVLLERTKDFDVNGPLEYARMPELGIISCPLKFELA